MLCPEICEPVHCDLWRADVDLCEELTALVQTLHAELFKVAQLPRRITRLDRERDAFVESLKGTVTTAEELTLVTDLRMQKALAQPLTPEKELPAF